MSDSKLVIGVDEVGRGCLAGDVFAAAVLQPDEHFDWWEATVGSIVMMIVGVFLFVMSASYLFS